MKDERITNQTAILFQSLPTCNTNPDCGSCLANSNFDWEYLDPSLDFERLEDGKKLECRWCPSMTTIDQSEALFLTIDQSQPSTDALMARTGTDRAG